MTRVLQVLLLSLALVCGVMSEPGGAPIEACEDMTPQHDDHEPLTENYPYVLDAKRNPDAYVVDLTITSSEDDSFIGFMVQARNVGDAEVPAVGTFSSEDENVQTLDCWEEANNTVTHTNGGNKTNVSFTWTPPEPFVDVYFIMSTVKNESTFWVNQTIPWTLDDMNSATSLVLSPLLAALSLSLAVWTRFV